MLIPKWLQPPNDEPVSLRVRSNKTWWPFSSHLVLIKTIRGKRGDFTKGKCHEAQQHAVQGLQNNKQQVGTSSDL